MNRQSAKVAAASPMHSSYVPMCPVTLASGAAAVAIEIAEAKAVAAAGLGPTRSNRRQSI